MPALREAHIDPPDDVRRAFEAGAPAVFRHALKLTKDRTKAEDLAQRALLRAWGYIGTFEAGSNMGAWLHVITRHEHMNGYRGAAGRTIRTEIEDPDGDYAAMAMTPARAVEAIELQETLDAITRLSADHREVLGLALDGMNVYQQAAALHIADGTAKSRLFRARRALREAMGE